MVAAAFIFGTGCPAKPHAATPRLPQLGPAVVSWAIPFGGGGHASGRGVAIGADGRVVIAGSYAGSLHAGSTVLRSGGGDDAFAIALSPGGQPLWARGIGGPGSDGALAVAVDARGAVAVAGSFADALTVDGRRIAASGSSDGFVAVFAANGALRWIRAVHSSDYSALEAVAFTDDGGVAAGGYFAGTVAAPGGALTSAGDADMLVVRYGADGSEKWARRGGGRGPDFVHGVASAGRGRIAIAGSIERHGDLGDTEIGAKHTVGVIALLGADGSPAWVRALAGSGDCAAYAVARVPGPKNGLAVTGTFAGSIPIGDSTLDAAGDTDAFVAMLAATGAPEWSRRIGGPGPDLAYGVAATARAIIATGSFQGTAAAAGQELHSAGDSDLYAAAYAADGTPWWAQAFGGSGEDAAGGVAAAAHRIAVAGTVAGDSRFGDRALAHQGDADAVAALLSP